MQTNHSIPITVQIATALHKQNRLATALGALLGGIVPVMVFHVSHDLPGLPVTCFQFYFLLGMAIGGCMFSAKSVYQWGFLAFNRDKMKAVAFALLLEGMLIMSGMRDTTVMHWLGYVALAYLVMVNAINSGCGIACEGKSAKQLARATIAPTVKGSKRKTK